MVFAAPLFLMTQTKAFSYFYQANREPLLRMGLGVLAAWMGLRAVSKSYEAAKLSEDVDMHLAQLSAVRALVNDSAWVAQVVASSGYVTSQADKPVLTGSPTAEVRANASASSSAVLAAALLSGVDSAIRAVHNATLAGKPVIVGTADQPKGVTSHIGDWFSVPESTTRRLVASRDKSRSVLGEVDGRDSSSGSTSLLPVATPSSGDIHRSGQVEQQLKTVTKRTFV